MSYCRWAAVLGVILAVKPVQAQVIVAPGWGPPPARGVGFTYHKRGVTVSGFYGSVAAPPYGWPGFYPGPLIEQRVIITPPPLVIAPRRFEYDLGGIDLDVEHPDKLDPRWPNVPPAAKQPAPDMRRMPPARDDAPAKPKQEDAPAKPPAPPRPDLEEPRAEPAAEGRRLVELGVLAFQKQEYALAAAYFRRAADIDAAGSRAYLLLSQAYFALGKFRDAARTIEDGMRRNPRWPETAFEPRVDLYKNMEADWLLHKKQLEDVVGQHPRQAAYLFLLAHQLWFDGLREEAAALFRRARPLVGDPQHIDAFLRLAPPEPLVLQSSL